MKVIENLEQLEVYIRSFQLEAIFPEKLKEHLHLYAFKQGNLFVHKDRLLNIFIYWWMEK